MRMPVSPLMTPAEVCAALGIDATALEKLRTTTLRLKCFVIDADLVRFDRHSVLAFTNPEAAG